VDKKNAIPLMSPTVERTRPPPTNNNNQITLSNTKEKEFIENEDDN
jgi:hypothetical protein